LITKYPAESRKPFIIITSNAWYFDEIGGAYKIATDFAIFCAQKGHDVHYICASERIRGIESAMEKGIKVWRYSKPMGIKKGGGVANLLTHLTQSRKIMVKIQQSIKHGNEIILNGHSALQYLGAIHGLQNSVNCRKVLSVHSPLTEEYKADKRYSRWSLFNQVKVAAFNYIEGSCYRRSDTIQCNSEFTRGVIEKNFPQDTKRGLVVCPGYVNRDQFSLINLSRATARQKLQKSVWDTQDTIFFCLRRHVNRMGIDNLIRAAACVRKGSSAQKRSFRVIIGGDGPLRAKMEELAAQMGLSGGVFFIGHVSEEELPYCYRASDCFVLPTRALECFGLIILESFAVGTPVIATPVGAIPEVLGPFAAASLTNGISAEDIAESILKFLENKHSSESERKLYEYAKKFDKQSILTRLEGIVTGKFGGVHSLGDRS